MFLHVLDDYLFYVHFYLCLSVYPFSYVYVVINMAIDSSRSPYGPQKMALLKRRNERRAAEERKRLEEDAKAEHEEKLRQQQRVGGGWGF